MLTTLCSEPQIRIYLTTRACLGVCGSLILPQQHPLGIFAASALLDAFFLALLQFFSVSPLPHFEAAAENSP